ncbi:hypothetical protein H2203_008853 [Taxawa tesnikishii (nom. ined.)]|nr:hypothetical protein H2203_008853 [Dothideales sp. JES 119]
MDTGILSIILHLLPYQFRGLGILSTIMFTFNVGLFAIFSCIGLARLFLFTEHARNQAISMIEETSYLAAPCVAYLTLVGQVSLTCSTAWGHGWTIAAYVFWWIGMAWTVTLCSATVVILTKRSITDDRNIVPAIFLPLISVMTAGTTGGIVVNYSYHISARMAVPVIIVSYMCIGYALFLSIMFYSVYLHRLMTEGPPQFAKTPTMIITVGPLGQFATAIQVLGTAAYTKADFSQYHKGTFLEASAGSVVSAVGTLLALLVVGFAFFWITVAWYIVIEAMLHKLPFNLTWWSMIFPMGVLTTALINLSVAMDSPAFRGLSTALLLFLLIIYFYNLVMTLYKIKSLLRIS